jgi:hypothetical protein
MLPLFPVTHYQFPNKILEKGANINRGINFGHHYTATAYQ